MSTDIFDFWSHVKREDRVHPADRDVLDRVEHGFDLRCLPSCFMGPLKTANVVLLYLSPGFGDGDLEEAASERGQLRYHQMRTGTQPLPGPDDHRGGWIWWESRTKSFGDWQALRDKVAVLNIGCYHSKNFSDEPLLAALPSSRACLDWAQSALFPEAINGNRMIICLRSAKFWGLTRNKKFGKSLYAPPVTRSGHMMTSEMQREIVREVATRCGIISQGLARSTTELA